MRRNLENFSVMGVRSCGASSECTGTRTWTIWQGSCRPLTHMPASNFSRFLDGIDVVTIPWPACEGRISHQGASVSNMSFSLGIDWTTFTRQRPRSQNARR